MNEHEVFQIAYAQGFVSTLTEPRQRDPEKMERQVLLMSDVTMDRFATWLITLGNLESQDNLTESESSTLLGAWLRGFLQGMNAAIEGLFRVDEERVAATAEVSERIAIARRNDEEARAVLWYAGSKTTLGKGP